MLPYAEHDKLLKSIECKKKDWPSLLCKTKYCACELVYFYDCIKDYYVCVGCKSTRNHPHMEKINPLNNKVLSFERRLFRFEITNIYTTFPEYTLNYEKTFDEARLRMVHDISSETDSSDFDSTDFEEDSV
jgi:hypothetical protein